MSPLPRHHTPRELGELAQLLFEWPIRRAPRLALPFFIVVAGLIQAVIVVLFSIHYGVAEEQVPPQPRFYFLPADSPVARKITPWLEAHDPAVFSPLRATERAVPAPPPLRYRPSYEDPPPPLRPLPFLDDTLAGPPDLPLTGETSHAAPVSGMTVPSVATISHPDTTEVRWMDGLANRQPTDAGAKSCPTPSLEGGVSLPSLYQVAVGPEGIPLTCVLTGPSGNPEADESGRAWILGRRFPPSEGITWGRALLVWNGSPKRGASAPANP